jgi:hypothetical protein
MNLCAKLAAAAAFASLGFAAAGAETTDAVMPASPEAFCDYCADYTDKATSAGMVASTYRPGVGYGNAAASEATQSVALQPPKAMLQAKAN